MDCFKAGWLLFFLFLNIKAFALCVSTETANLRSGPGPQHNVTWVAPKFTPLVEHRREGNWIEVEDQDGEKHWLYAPNSTNRFNCLSVRTNTANLRSQPSASAPLGDMRQADKYTPFKRLDRLEEWHQVEAPWGGEYWIHESTVWRPIKVQTISY